MQVPIFYETINFIEVIFPTRSKRWNQTKHYCYDKVDSPHNDNDLVHFM